MPSTDSSVAQHTPGPWRFDYIHIWSSSSKRMVAAVSEPDPPSRLVEYVRPSLSTQNLDEIYANGQLIAAAPALLAALKAQAMRSFVADGTYCWCSGTVDDIATHEHDPQCRMARVAVAAAEGNVS